MRPTPSTSTSAAPESINLLNPRVSGFTIESDCSFLATTSHASREYAKRQLSKPRVMTIFLPIAARKTFGSETRFFSSNVCSYSPISKFSMFPTLSHYDRVYTTIHHSNLLIHTTEDNERTAIKRSV